MGGGADAVSDGAAEEGSHDMSNEEDEHVERTQVLEGGDVGVADEEVGVASGEEGSSGSSKEKEGKEQSEVEKVADANPAYAKYLLEKRQMSEELKQRSEWTQLNLSRQDFHNKGNFFSRARLFI